MNDYGIGFNQAQDYQPSFTINAAAAQNGAGPPVPHKESSITRKPIMDSDAGPEKQKKRRSWFGIGKGN